MIQEHQTCWITFANIIQRKLTTQDQRSDAVVDFWEQIFQEPRAEKPSFFIVLFCCGYVVICCHFRLYLEKDLSIS